jgi:hypothetical protein
MHVALDMDDVVVEFEQGVVDSVRLEFGVELPLPKVWDDPKTFKGFEGFGKGGFWGWMRERDWVWATFQPVQGAIGGIRRLRQAGHVIELVTSKPEWAEPQVWRWLGKWRPPVNRVTLIQTEKMTKAKACPEAAVLVDDKVANCVDFVESDRFAVLFDRPQNRGFDENENQGPLFKGKWKIERAHGWEDVLGLIEFIDGMGPDTRPSPPEPGEFLSPRRVIFGGHNLGRP